jgi:hypothetical protein
VNVLSGQVLSLENTTSSLSGRTLANE